MKPSIFLEDVGTAVNFEVLDLFFRTGSLFSNIGSIQKLLGLVENTFLAQEFF